MNFLKKGPELKLSEIKVPGFVQDVYYDLKDRHLLPVAAILVVAIFAVPIALSSGSDSEEAAPGAAAGASASQSGAAATSGQLVAEAAPGLRDYKRRLDDGKGTDPFENGNSAPEQDGSEGEPEGSPSAKPSSTPESPESVPYVPPTSGGAPGTGRLIHYSYAIDVRVSGGSGNQKKSTVRENLPSLTMLPSRETPAIVYMGSTKDGKKAVMTVSSDVQAIFGDAKCVLGSQTCQMLVMEEGLPETFVYGGSGKTYTIELLKIELVESDKLNKAALGDPKKGGKKKGASSLSGLVE